MKIIVICGKKFYWQTFYQKLDDWIYRSNQKVFRNTQKKEIICWRTFEKNMQNTITNRQNGFLRKNNIEEANDLLIQTFEKMDEEMDPESKIYPFPLIKEGF